MYVPPFRYTDKIVNLVAEITQLLEQFELNLNEKESLRLRKANRIKTIYSSLAIEGATVSEEQVRDIVDGKFVLAPLKELQVVKNAIATYELATNLDPFKVEDLLRAHKTMMAALIDSNGCFRKDGVGVFGDQGCVHMAPPSERVPYLIEDLFNWVARSEINLLVRSCIFHYEFEFIHPFADGNGRMGRLWQSLLLAQMSPIFAYLPVENLVFANQQDYYDAFMESNEDSCATPFVEYMLGEILTALKKYQGEALVLDFDGINLQSNFVQIFGKKFARTFARTFAQMLAKNFKASASREKALVAFQEILILIKTKDFVNANHLAKLLELAPRTIRNYLKQLSDAKLIEYTGTTNNGNWRVL